MTTYYKLSVQYKKASDLLLKLNQITKFPVLGSREQELQLMDEYLETRVLIMRLNEQIIRERLTIEA